MLSLLAMWMQSRVHTDDEGASLVEYALLLVLIAVVAIVIVTQVGGSVSETFSEIDSGLTR